MSFPLLPNDRCQDDYGTLSVTQSRRIEFSTLRKSGENLRPDESRVSVVASGREAHFRPAAASESELGGNYTGFSPGARVTDVTVRTLERKRDGVTGEGEEVREKGHEESFLRARKRSQRA